MLIDWFTVIAQIINFIILVFLLGKFLYKPVLKAIDDREKRIAAQLKDAADKEAGAKKLQEEFEQKNREFDRQKAEMMNEVTKDNQAEAQRLLDEARKKADEFGSGLLGSMKDEQKKLITAISNSTRQEVFAITRKTLFDLAGTTLEEMMTDAFVKKLKILGKDEKEQLAKAISTDSATGAVKIITAFNLQAAQQKTIESAINETFPGCKNVSFIVAPELVSGVELSAGGYKMGWSINDYLNSLEKKTEILLAAKLESEFGAIARKK